MSDPRPPRQGVATAARLAAVQVLYQVEMDAMGAEAALRAATGGGAELDEVQRLTVDPLMLAEIVHGVDARKAEIDAFITGSLDAKWRLERLEMVLRAILRAGAFELLARPGVPARVVINEYVDVAHAFFEHGEPGLVNAVLDRLARALRGDELAAAKP